MLCEPDELENLDRTYIVDSETTSVFERPTDTDSFLRDKDRQMMVPGETVVDGRYVTLAEHQEILENNVVTF